VSYLSANICEECIQLIGEQVYSERIKARKVLLNYS
jgi:hypothetical protein